MKKSTKVLLWMAVAFLALGTLLIGSSLLLGVHPIQAVRDGVLDVPLQQKRNSEFSPDGCYSIPTEGITEVSVDWLSGNIRIEPYDGTELRLEERGPANFTESNSLDFRLDDGKLNISSTPQYIGLSLRPSVNTDRKDLVLLVPTSLHLQELDLDIFNSDLTMQGLTLNNLSVDTVSGSTTLTQSNLHSLSFDSTGGGLTLEESAVDELDADTASGSLSGQLTHCPQQLEFDTVSGTLQLTLPEDSQFQLNLSTVSGKLISDFDGSFQEDSYIVGSGSSKFEIDSASGSAEFHIASPTA